MVGTLIISFLLFRTCRKFCSRDYVQMPMYLKGSYCVGFCTNLMTCLIYGLFRTNILFSSRFFESDIGCPLSYFISISSYAIAKNCVYLVFILKIDIVKLLYLLCLMEQFRFYMAVSVIDISRFSIPIRSSIVIFIIWFNDIFTMECTWILVFYGWFIKWCII